jgi:hypothetical protein
VQYHAAVAVLFDEGVVFIGLLDCSTVAGRPSGNGGCEELGSLTIGLSLL